MSATPAKNVDAATIVGHFINGQDVADGKAIVRTAVQNDDHVLADLRYAADHGDDATVDRAARRARVEVERHVHCCGQQAVTAILDALEGGRVFSYGLEHSPAFGEFHWHTELSGDGQRTHEEAFAAARDLPDARRAT